VSAQKLQQTINNAENTILNQNIRINWYLYRKV
jgi:hypothetical protein